MGHVQVNAKAAVLADAHLVAAAALVALAVQAVQAAESVATGLVKAHRKEDKCKVTHHSFQRITI